MTELLSIPDDLSEIIRVKERELHDINELRYERLEVNLLEKEKLIFDFIKRFDALKDDFQYNLTLLDARDHEIIRLEQIIENLTKEFEIKKHDNQQLLKKLDQFEKTTQVLYETRTREQRETQVS